MVSDLILHASAFDCRIFPFHPTCRGHHVGKRSEAKETQPRGPPHVATEQQQQVQPRNELLLEEDDCVLLIACMLDDKYCSAATALYDDTYKDRRDKSTTEDDINILLIQWVEKICRRFVFAPVCRGATAKRSGPPIATPAMISQKSRALDNTILQEPPSVFSKDQPKKDLNHFNEQDVQRLNNFLAKYYETLSTSSDTDLEDVGTTSPPKEAIRQRRSFVPWQQARQSKQIQIQRRMEPRYGRSGAFGARYGRGGAFEPRYGRSDQRTGPAIYYGTLL